MIYRYRCGTRTCQTRKSLPHLIDWYIRRPVCPSCKGNTLRLDKWRMQHEVGKGAPTCTCDGYHFPHREGSLWCIHSKVIPTEEQQRERYENGYIR